MIRLLTAVALVCTALTVNPATATAAAPAQNTQNGKVLECELLGGTVIPQPPGSAITACCYDEGETRGCWICDENGNDCVFDEANARPDYGQRPWVIMVPMAAIPVLQMR